MTTVHTPGSLLEIRGLSGEFRAGGIDVEARRRTGLAGDEVIDISRLEGLDTIEVGPRGATIGAGVRISDVARHPDLVSSYPALTVTAGSLANPHTRAVATVGGNLFQRTRCWYFRTGRVSCHKTGGSDCPARAGIHHFGVVFDTSPCVAPHPSSLAMALLCYDATVVVDGQGERSLAEALGDGSDATRDHALAPGELVTSIVLPPGNESERAAYLRATSRRLAEWPLVEAVCRMSLDADTITSVQVAAGGIAPRPIRLDAVEQALVGRPAIAATFAAAAAMATAGAEPLPGSAYKLDLLSGIVLDVLEHAHARSADHGELAFGELGLPR